MISKVAKTAIFAMAVICISASYYCGYEAGYSAAKNFHQGCCRSLDKSFDQTNMTIQLNATHKEVADFIKDKHAFVRINDRLNNEGLRFWSSENASIEYWG